MRTGAWTGVRSDGVTVTMLGWTGAGAGRGIPAVPVAAATGAAVAAVEAGAATAGGRLTVTGLSWTAAGAVRGVPAVPVVPVVAVVAVGAVVAVTVAAAAAPPAPATVGSVTWLPSRAASATGTAPCARGGRLARRCRRQGLTLVHLSGQPLGGRLARRCRRRHTGMGRPVEAGAGLVAAAAAAEAER